jgi:CDP-paratose 2-epimerase
MDKHGKRLQVFIGDIRDTSLLSRVVKNVRIVYHFAAQVAVTESIINPLNDFSINCQATINLLEIIRSINAPPFLLFTSTNKVYGNLSGLPLHKSEIRYVTEISHPASGGISETWNLDFHSPYGCSKGSADQYVLDYSRMYGIYATVFRMSCIYGPHQYGNEDQGWIAHLLSKILRDEPITVYGDGLQVRDILYIDDLVQALLRVKTNQAACSGHAFTIGGGPDHSISIMEFIKLAGAITNKIPQVNYSSWRPGDQKYYISDTSSFRALCDWQPEISVHRGIEKIFAWLSQSISSDILQERQNDVIGR